MSTPSKQLELRLLRRVAEVPRATWDALVRPEDSPFVEHTWLDALEESGCVGDEETGWTPLHVAVYDAGELVAAAPSYVKVGSEGEFVFDWSWADVARRLGVSYYPKLVTAVPFTPATGARVLVHPSRAGERDAIVRTVANALAEIAPQVKVSGVHALFPTAAEAALWADAGYAERYGVQYHWRNEGYATFEDFLKDMPSKKRTQIRRETKQPEKDGVTIETLAPADYTLEMTRTMFELYLTTVDKFVWGRQYLNRHFFALVVDRFRDRLSWVVAKKEGKVIAGAFNVKKHDRLYGRYWGTFVDLPFLHFNVCYYHGIRQAIDEGLAVFEPGAGGEHKRARGFRPTLTYSAHRLLDPRLRAVIEPFLARERAALRDHVADVTEP